MVRKHISIEPEQEKRLKQYAHQTGLKEAEVFRQALSDYLDGCDEWDLQMKRDYEDGRLDGILVRAKKQYRKGDYSEL